MFDLFNSYDIKKLTSKIEELENRIKTLESKNGIEFKPPVNQWTAKVDSLTDEEFTQLTNIISNPDKYRDVEPDTVPQKVVEYIHELVCFDGDKQSDCNLFIEAIRDRQMREIKGFTEMLIGGKRE